MAATSTGQGIWRGAPPAGLCFLSLPDALLCIYGAHHEEERSAAADERTKIEEEEVEEGVTLCTQTPEGFTLDFETFLDKHEHSVHLWEGLFVCFYGSEEGFWFETIIMRTLWSVHITSRGCLRVRVQGWHLSVMVKVRMRGRE